jgi:hypothetical protein
MGEPRTPSDSRGHYLVAVFTERFLILDDRDG